MRSAIPVRRLAALAVCGALAAACTAAPSTPSPPATVGPTAAATPTAAPKGELPKPELASLRLGFSAAGEMSQFAGIQASMAKIYDKYGISATVSTFEGEAKAVGALQSGQIDIGIAGPGSALSSQTTDVPLIIVAMNASFLTDDIVCGAAVKSAADAKGKKLAVSSFGGTSHASALLGIKAMGLGAADMVVTVVGGEGARVAAVKGGSVECAVVDKVRQTEMLGLGFNIVASIYNPPQPFGRSATAITKDFLAKNPNTVLVAVAAILESQNLIWTDTTGTAQRFAQHLQSTVAVTGPRVTEFQAVGNRSLLWKDEIFTNGKKVLAAINPDIIDVDNASAQDMTLLQKLIDNGFYDKINNPARTP